MNDTLIEKNIILTDLNQGINYCGIIIVRGGLMIVVTWVNITHAFTNE